MPDFSLVPVDHQPDFSDVSLVPVDHDPFSDSAGIVQQARAQPAQTQNQPAQSQPESPPQTPATGMGQPNVGAPVIGDGRGGSHCGSDPGHCGFGQAIGAIGDGAYSDLEGVGNALRFVGRSIGLYGPDEINRSDQEIRAAIEAIKDGGRLLMDSPEARSVAIRATEEAAAAYWQNERNRYFLLGRIGFGVLTGVAPVAVIGDSTRALEKGHNAIESLGKGIIGNRQP
jgi:hypothetical protein